MREFSYEQIGLAIDYWKGHEANGGNAIGRNMSLLGDVLGTMIFYEMETFPEDKLSADQGEALSKALLQMQMF